MAAKATEAQIDLLRLMSGLPAEACRRAIAEKPAGDALKALDRLLAQGHVSAAQVNQSLVSLVRENGKSFLKQVKRAERVSALQDLYAKSLTKAREPAHDSATDSKPSSLDSHRKLISDIKAAPATPSLAQQMLILKKAEIVKSRLENAAEQLDRILDTDRGFSSFKNEDLESLCDDLVTLLPAVDLLAQLDMRVSPNLREQASLIRGERPATPLVIERPPLPVMIQVSETFWEGIDLFPSWSRLNIPTRSPGRYLSHSIDRRAIVRLHNSTRANTIEAPSIAQLNAYAFLKANEEKITHLVASAIPGYLKKLRDELDWGDLVGDIPEVTGLGSRICVDAIVIQAAEKDGLAYVGFAFDCDWDPEHECGVLTHGLDIIQIGHADVSFDDPE